MVHKKSEYRLQFHVYGKDLRTKIWQDNIKFRETCRKLNQAEHYWTYQLTDERCKCDNDEEEEEDQATIPPHRLKHKVLLVKYEDKEKTGQPQSFHTEEKLKEDLHVARDIAVQTPDWERQELRETDTSNQEVLRLAELPENPKSEHTMLKEKKHYPSESMNRNIQIHKTASQPRDFKSHDNEPCSSSLGHYVEKCSSSRTSSPTRTNRKAYFEVKKSPFVSFGWNDAHRDVGQKKTHNVYAPKKEVYSHALLAQNRRKEAIEAYLLNKAEKKRQEERFSGVVNHSSIWMSEYQERFSQGTTNNERHVVRRCI